MAKTVVTAVHPHSASIKTTGDRQGKGRVSRWKNMMPARVVSPTIWPIGALEKPQVSLCGLISATQHQRSTPTHGRRNDVGRPTPRTRRSSTSRTVAPPQPKVLVALPCSELTALSTPPTTARRVSGSINQGLAAKNSSATMAFTASRVASSRSNRPGCARQAPSRTTTAGIMRRPS